MSVGTFERFKVQTINTEYQFFVLFLHKSFVKLLYL